MSLLVVLGGKTHRILYYSRMIDLLLHVLRNFINIYQRRLYKDFIPIQLIVLVVIANFGLIHIDAYQFWYHLLVLI